MASMTVDELRASLIRYGESEESVAQMKKAELTTRYLDLVSKEAGDNMEFELEQCGSAQEVNPKTIEQALGVSYGSQEWADFVLGHLKDDEMVDGYPKCNGLRRVAQLVLGDFLSAKATQIFITNSEEGRVVTVNYEIEIDWRLSRCVDFGALNGMLTNDVRVFGGLADCVEDKASVFGRHPAATAESKAEGRALRKALCLNVVSAEERILGSDEEMPKARATSSIIKPLRDIIMAKTSALKLDISNMIKEWSGKDRPLEDLTTEEGRELFAYINKYQQTKQ